MDVTAPVITRLSQGHLNLLETCPPQFQRVYLDQLNTPPDPDQLSKQAWGSQFHRLMQQRELGLPIEPLLEKDDQLQHSLTSLLEAAPEIGRNEGIFWREAEHCRTLYLQDYLLTVIYDLILVWSDRALILDWKTYLKPAEPQKLAKSWQTRLYLYVLAETSPYAPEQISMTYWFVQLPRTPERITFDYNRQLHDRAGQDLNRLLCDLDRYLLDYQTKGSPFPHRLDCQTSCPYSQEEGRSIELSSLESIEEIEEINPFAREFSETVVTESKKIST